MIFGEGPIIKNIAGDLNKLFLQGTRAGQPINNVEGDAAADQATIQLMADRDPVIRDISTGLGWAGREVTVSGTGALQLVNSLGRPLKSWSVELAPYQEGSGDPSPENVRPIHGTNKLTIYTDSKYGGLVAWNQQAHDMNATNWRTESGVTASIANGIATFNSTIVNNGLYSLNYHPITNGHIYYISFSVKANSGVGVRQTISNAIGFSNNVTGNGSWISSQKIIRANADSNTRMYVIATTADGGDIEIKNIMLCDLTTMFGAGNEPSTVEEFRALITNEYYPYNAGQQMTVDQVNGVAYTPIVIILPQIIYKGYAGSDAGENTQDKLILDGSELWTLSAQAGRFFYTSADTMKKWTSYSSNRIMCDKLLPCTNQNADEYFQTVNAITGYADFDNVYPNQNWIYAKADSRATVAEFKTWLTENPVAVVYDLATPSQFALTTPTIPTAEGDGYAWITAEDGIVTSFSATYLQSE